MLGPIGRGTRRGGSRVMERHFVPVPNAIAWVTRSGRVAVHRIIANDAEEDAVFSRPDVPVADAARRSASHWQRWSFAHRPDFAAWRHTRPAWDIVGLAGSATDTYLAVRRMRSDIVALLRKLSPCAAVMQLHRVESS
jgi:hypothetical protein